MRYLWVWAFATLLTLGAKTANAGFFSINERTEIRIGRQAASKLEAQQGIWNNPEQTERVRRIGMSIARTSPRPKLPWSFKITNERQINAMALPGGFVYATRGLIESGMDDQELAGVMAHEVAHVTQRHAVKIIEKATTLSFLASLALGRSAAAIQTAADIALGLVIRKGYREEEYDADRVGTKLAYRSGYRADGLLDFLQLIRQKERSEPSGLQLWLSTHPPTSDRIARLERFIPTLRAAPVARG